MGFEKFGLISYTSQTRVSKFIDYLAEGKIYGTVCRECGYVQFPPRAHCTRCFSSSWDWKQLSGGSTLVTYSKVEAAPAMFKDQAPYILGLAEFAEGPKVLAWIDKTIPETEIAAGMKLELTVVKLANRNLTYQLTKPTPH